MIGDIILAIKKWWKQQTCIHTYRIDKLSVRLTCVSDMKVCTKCDRYKAL